MIDSDPHIPFNCAALPPCYALECALMCIWSNPFTICLHT